LDLQDLGSLGELVAAVATLATLAYLTLQIRQNTQAIRGSTVHLVTQTQQKELHWGGEIAEVFTKAIEKPGELNTTETWQMSEWLISATAARQNEFIQFRHSHIASEVWDESENIILQIFSFTWSRHWWTTMGRPLFAKDFVAVVDALLSKEVPSEFDMYKILQQLKSGGV
jgi:hypothetical protein